MQTVRTIIADNLNKVRAESGGFTDFAVKALHYFLKVMINIPEYQIVIDSNKHTITILTKSCFMPAKIDKKVIKAVLTSAGIQQYKMKFKSNG